MAEPDNRAPEEVKEGRRGNYLLVGFLGLGALAMVALVVFATVPLLPSGHRDAKQAEGSQLMGSARDAFRVGYAQNRNTTEAHASLQKDITASRMNGRYYRIVSSATRLPDGRWQVTAVPNEAGLKTGTLTFDMESGQSEIAWR